MNRSFQPRNPDNASTATDIAGLLSEYAAVTEDALAGIMKALVSRCPDPVKRLLEASSYSLLAGGKRMRPCLSLMVCDMLGGDRKVVLPFACAIEMIHAYSLVHDDLPAMDNDTLRRGRPTCHAQYGEALAILVGDHLLNLAFEVMIGTDAPARIPLRRRLRAMGLIAEAAGCRGMIGGQVMDISGEAGLTEQLDRMHRMKTGALIRASVTASACLCGARPEEERCLAGYADALGLAFQIRDDMLDVTGNAVKTGKTTGRDRKAGKYTYVDAYGMEEAGRRLRAGTEEAVASLEPFGSRAEPLIRLARLLAEREA